jgi:hypothetical protein
MAYEESGDLISFNLPRSHRDTEKIVEPMKKALDPLNMSGNSSFCCHDVFLDKISVNLCVSVSLWQIPIVLRFYIFSRSHYL